MKTCLIDDCETTRIHGRGMCQKHYLRVKNHGDPHANPRWYAPAVCSIDTCTEPTKKRGRYCTTHRARIERHGTAELPVRADRHSNQRGYQLIRRPGHPLARKDHWAYEHRVVLYDAIGPGTHPCHWCQKPVSWDQRHTHHPDALVVDHVDEDVRNNDRTNLVPACGPCNVRRSSPTVKRKAAARAS